MKRCEWFDDKVLKIQKNISNNFEVIHPPEKYKNVVTDLKISNCGFKFNLPSVISEDIELIATHKYKINFNKDQQLILFQYFKECERLYNLCVDIWQEYKNMTSNYFIVKDVIFKYLYRQQNTDIDKIKNLIIVELKEKQRIFNIENEENQEKIALLKLEAKNKYKEEMIEYKKLKKINDKATVKIKLIKPKLEKIKIDKIKQPPKEKGKKIAKPAPDEPLKYEIKEFCKNLSNARQQAIDNKFYDTVTKKINDDAFILKYKNISSTQTMFVSKRNIGLKGIYPNKLKELKCKNYKNILEKYEINKDCLLQYNFKLKNFYFLVVHEDKYIKSKKLKNRNEIVSVDPGEKIFMYFYSTKYQGKIGDNMRIKILKTQRKIKKYQSIVKTKKNKQKKKIKNLSKIKKKLNQLYCKIKNYVNEIHKKGAKFLCENYENILVPKFETKPMISKYKITQEKNEIDKIKNDKEKAKQKLKELNKQIKLSNNVKFVLSMQSHYRFKEYLKQYAKKYRTIVHDVDESYTSQCCSFCGILSKEYNNKRVKTCISCKKEIDRDENGAKNIYLKCLNAMPGFMLD